MISVVFGSCRMIDIVGNFGGGELQGASVIIVLSDRFAVRMPYDLDDDQAMTECRMPRNHLHRHLLRVLGVTAFGCLSHGQYVSRIFKPLLFAPDVVFATIYTNRGYTKRTSRLAQRTCVAELRSYPPRSTWSVPLAEKPDVTTAAIQIVSDSPLCYMPGNMWLSFSAMRRIRFCD